MHLAKGDLWNPFSSHFAMKFSDYLRHHNLPQDLSGDHRKTAYQQYRSWYKREHQKQQRQKTKRLEISLSEQQYQVLQQQAQKHQRPLSTFAKDCIWAYLENMYIVPDEHTIQDLETGMRRIGNNINQLVMHVHRHKSISPQTIQTLRQQLGKLEQFLSRTLREPKDLTKLLREAIAQHPNYTQILRRIIDKNS